MKDVPPASRALPIAARTFWLTSRAAIPRGCGSSDQRCPSPAELRAFSFGESASGSPLEAVPLVGRMAGLKPWTAGAIGHFLGLSGLLKSLLDQLCFCVGDCAKAER